MATRYQLKDVFIPSGQPSVTYVQRNDLDIERSLDRALTQGRMIISLTGPTKCGKTVLCKRVLESANYVWVEGGQIRTEADVWSKVCYELNYPAEITKTQSDETGTKGQIAVKGEGTVPLFAKLGAIFTSEGSRLSAEETSRTYKIDSMASALRHLIEHKIVLVIDDFHYVPPEARAGLLRSLKGAVFNGLNVILLSVTLRAFEAIRAEPEITGRFRHIEVPEWRRAELIQIAERGFAALNAQCVPSIIQTLADESNGSPLLMQSFCWELCYDRGVKETGDAPVSIGDSADLKSVFKRIAKDMGQPIYERLAAGPQSRTPRIDRPLRDGGQADIYRAILLAIAQIGPKSRLSYNEIRTSLTEILADKVPQKLEVSNALNHLSKIAAEIATGERALEWDEKGRDLYLSDPYLRFFLRWQVRRNGHQLFTPAAP